MRDDKLPDCGLPDPDPFCDFDAIVVPEDLTMEDKVERHERYMERLYLEVFGAIAKAKDN